LKDTDMFLGIPVVPFTTAQFTLRSSNVSEHRDDTGVVSDASTLRAHRR